MKAVLRIIARALIVDTMVLASHGAWCLGHWLTAAGRALDERRLQQKIGRAELNAEKRGKIGDLAGAEEWKTEAALLREQLAELERT